MKYRYFLKKFLEPQMIVCPSAIVYNQIYAPSREGCGFCGGEEAEEAFVDERMKLSRRSSNFIMKDGCG